MVNLPFSSNNNSAFYFSGFLAIYIYIFFIILCLFYLNEHDVKTYDSTKKTTVIELDVMLSKNKEDTLSKVDTNKKIKKELIEKSASKSVVKKTDIKSLFANVKSEEKKVIKKVVNNVKPSSVSSRYKSKFEREKRTNGNLNLSKILDEVKTKKRKLAVVTSSKHENDPYYSQIDEILSKRWDPILIDNGLEAKVLITITNNGEFDYRFLKYSANKEFDTFLKKFLEEQKKLTYPPYTKGLKTTIEVTFKSKG